MTASKLAISLSSELEAQIRADARAAGQSVSGWLAEAAAERLRQRNLRTLVAAYEAEHGVFTDEEMRKVREAWPD